MPLVNRKGRAFNRKRSERRSAQSELTKQNCGFGYDLIEKTANFQKRRRFVHAPHRARLGVLSVKALRGASVGACWVRAPSVGEVETQPK